MNLRSLAVLLALALPACRGRANPDDVTPQSERNIIRITQIQEAGTQGIVNVYDLILRVHPEWFRSVRASATAASTPTVWVDLQRMGGLGYLRTMPLGGITSIRYLSPPEARGELGFDNPGGAIIVSTR